MRNLFMKYSKNKSYFLFSLLSDKTIVSIYLKDKVKKQTKKHVTVI